MADLYTAKGLEGSADLAPHDGLPASAGTYGWGGAASTDFWVDAEQELVGIVLTQLLPTGTYPLRPTMEVLTYQAIVE